MDINFKDMTEEQYQKVISLDKRLNELKGVFRILDNNDTHLSYMRRVIVDIMTSSVTLKSCLL